MRGSSDSVRRPRCSATRTAPGDLCRIRATACSVKARDHAQRHHLGLVPGQSATMATACRVESFCSTSSSTGFPGVTGDGTGSMASILSRNRRRARAASMARCLSDGKEPGAELVHAALPELGQVADDLQPGLAGDVVDVVAADDLEVPQQPRLQRVPEDKEAGLVA